MTSSSRGKTMLHGQYIVRVLLTGVLFVSAADAGAKGACEKHYQAEQYEKAAVACQRAAAGGDVVSQRVLASMYVQGLGVEQNDEQGIRYFRAAAENGDADSQTTLGNFYSDGVVVAEDLAEARRWYRAAAEQGEPLAEAQLGTLYMTGMGGPRDSVEGEKWLTRAEQHGLAEQVAVARKALAQLRPAGEFTTSREFASAVCVASVASAAEQDAAARFRSDPSGVPADVRRRLDELTEVKIRPFCECVTSQAAIKAGRRSGGAGALGPADVEEIMASGACKNPFQG